MKKINPTMNQALMNALICTEINKIQKEYISFMNVTNFPKLVIKPINNKKRTSVSASVDYEKNSCILKVKSSLFWVTPDTVKSTIYHELTHVLDHTNLLQDIDYSEQKNIIWAFSEYHATYIQMMCACNFINVNDNKTIDEDTIVYDANTPKNVIDYLQHEQYGFITTMKILFDDGLPDKIIMALRHYIYYQSTIDFFNIYCNFNIFQYIDKNLCNDIFNDFFTEFVRSLRKVNENFNKYNNSNIFYEQHNTVKIFGEYFYNNKENICKILKEKLLQYTDK